MNAGLVNMLNISDGLLSDELCIKFICTFNAPLKDIDEALLRKGRLAARYEFKDLTTDKVNQLIKEEGLDIPQQTQPMTLAEIYNYEGMDFSLGRKRVDSEQILQSRTFKEKSTIIIANISIYILPINKNDLIFLYVYYTLKELPYYGATLLNIKLLKFKLCM